MSGWVLVAAAFAGWLTLSLIVGCLVGRVLGWASRQQTVPATGAGLWHEAPLHGRGPALHLEFDDGWDWPQ